MYIAENGFLMSYIKSDHKSIRNKEHYIKMGKRPKLTLDQKMKINSY